MRYVVKRLCCTSGTCGTCNPINNVNRSKERVEVEHNSYPDRETANAVAHNWREYKARVEERS